MNEDGGRSNEEEMWIAMGEGNCLDQLMLWGHMLSAGVGTRRR